MVKPASDIPKKASGTLGYLVYFIFAFITMVFVFDLDVSLNSAPYSTPTFGVGECNEHLVVLVHGLLGNSADLDYLGQRLRQQGCTVLQSKSNNYVRSLQGIKAASQRLVEEIGDTQLNYPKLKTISFVGNSLGGLFSRYALNLMSREGKSHLFFASDNISPLEPGIFMTIATPHIGVLDDLYLEDKLQHLLGKPKITLPTFAKKLVGKIMGTSGSDCFLDDADSITESLLYKMSIEEEYLEPLRWFEKRRLYANLDLDFMVSLNTAAFLEKDTVNKLRDENIHFANDKGKARIITRIFTDQKSSEDAAVINASSYDDEKEVIYARMRQRLNAVGWEKVVVYFPSYLPLALAHNKIASKGWFIQGRFVMDEAASYITNSSTEAPPLEVEEKREL
jgi:hypothetical protein